MANYPILNKANEAKAVGAGPVIEYKLSPEELERYRKGKEVKQETKAQPAAQQEQPEQQEKPKGKINNRKYNITKEFLEAELTAGKTITQIEREQGMREGTLYYYIKKYGIKYESKRGKKAREQQPIKEPANPGQQQETGQEKSVSLQNTEPASTSPEKTPDPQQDDIINRPAHYTAGKVECIDAIEAATVNLKGIEAVCTANVIKYVWRWKLKGGVEDLRKAEWYLRRLIRVAGGDGHDQGGT